MSGTQTTTETGVDLGDDPRRDDDLGPLDDYQAEDAFLKTLRGADDATDSGDDEGGTETDAETGASEDSAAGEQQDAGQQDDAPADVTNDAKKPAAGDDAIVEVKVGEETHRVPVKDLKRLFGQEAALTRRSQEVAEQRQVVQQDAERAKTVLQKAIDRAREKAKPYQEMDFLALSRKLDADTFDQLRKDAKEALDEVSFLEAEARQADEALTRARTASRAEAAVVAVRALNDPGSPHHIPGFGEEVYGRILEFATAQGYRGAVELTDPAAIKLIHKAMLYERGKTVVRDKVKKVAEQPKAVLRPGSTGQQTPRDRAANAHLDRLRRTGSPDDAEAAFLSRLRPRDDD